MAHAHEKKERLYYARHRCIAGELIETIEGVNSPAIEKTIADHLPEGMVDTAEDDAAGDGDEEED